MAARVGLPWKVYRGTHFFAACRYPEDAAVLVAAHGHGSTIKFEHAFVVWREGRETQLAIESYMFVARTVLERTAIEQQRRYNAAYGKKGDKR